MFESYLNRIGSEIRDKTNVKYVKCLIIIIIIKSILINIYNNNKYKRYITSKRYLYFI